MVSAAAWMLGFPCRESKARFSNRGSKTHPDRSPFLQKYEKSMGSAASFTSDRKNLSPASLLLLRIYRGNNYAEGAIEMRKPKTSFQIIPVRKLDRSEHRFTLLSPSDIAFVFVGSALIRGRVGVTGVQSKAFKPDRLYLRTTSGAYFSTFHRSLKELCHRLDSNLFQSIQKSLVVNIQKAKEIDFREKQIGIALIDGSLVWLNISRRQMARLRRRLFYPAKKRKKQGGPIQPNNDR